MLLDQKLRDICIQDPRHETAYLIPASALEEFAHDSSAQKASAGVVTFTITYDSLVDVVPELGIGSTTEPDVILRDCDSTKEYHLTFAQLQQFQIDRPDVHPLAKTFTLPMPEALVEEMPSAMRALLQTAIPGLDTPS